MLGFVKRLFGRSENSRSAARAAHSRPRSVTAELLAQGRHAPAARTAAKQKANEFDPYNTGKFDRAASWERVRHSHR